MASRRPPRAGPPGRLVLGLPLTLYAELQAEAWEEGLPIEMYVQGLLTRRGKWFRTVGSAGGYEIMSRRASPPRVLREPKDDEEVPDEIAARLAKQGLTK